MLKSRRNRKELKNWQMKFKNLIIRTLSGAGFVAVMVAGLLLNKYLFAAVMIFIMGIMMHEFFKMTMGDEYRFSRALAIFAAITLFSLTFLYKGHVWNFPGRLVILAMIPIFIVMVNSLYVKDKTDFGKFANLYTAILYIAVPMTLMNFAVFSPGGEFSGLLLLGFFIIIWASDAGAYVFGMAFGQKFGKKLFPEISPKKSWIGFWGGFVLSVAVAVLLYYTGLFPDSYHLPNCILLAVLMNISGVYGDLVESQWKRHYALKDSGNLIPGHGGMLDRFDSALFAVPVGVIYLMVHNILW